MKKQTEKSLLARNEQLEKKLEKKEASLQKVKRDLKIEASLERVRSVAMRMHKSEHLSEISEVIFTQLKSLGFSKLRNTEIIINNDDKESVLSYYYSDYGVTGTIEIFYKDHPTVKDWAEQLRKANDAFASIVISEGEMEAWRAYRLEIGYLPDPKLNEANSVNYYSYSIGRGGLSISSFKPLTHEQVKVLERFRNVFALAYQRYIDVTEAEAQAREAKLEASLERMRAVAMSMRKSEELITVCEAMYRELGALGFSNIRNAQIALKNDAKQSYRISVYSDYEVVAMQEAPYKSSPIVEELFNELATSKDAFYQKEFSGKKFKEWRKWRETLSPLKDAREATASSMCFYLYSIGSGHLGISTFNAITHQQIEILKRFRNVFELSYQRYTDVAKAEAQAQEAKIEVSLERVRSNAMGMHSSEELSQTINVFFKELKSLGVLPWRCGVGRIEEDTHTTYLTTTSITKDGDSFPVSGKLKQEGHPVLDGIFDHWKLQEEYFPVLRGNEIRAYYDVVSPQIAYPDYPVDTVQFGHFMFFKEGFVFAWTEKKFSEDELGVFRKFTSVLSLTYRRYLDLKEAEAQAREAQIELGLERVRARAMAMQHSGELSELVDTLFAELTKLDFALTWCMINTIDERTLSNRVWTVNAATGKIPESFYMKFEDYPFHHGMMKAWKERMTQWVYVLQGPEKKIYDDYLLNETEFRRIPETAKTEVRAAERLVCSFTFSNFGGLQTVGSEPLSAANLDILARFGKVFDLTYTRFLDLQQAESQARESQIQLALERVRARTMAMQKSEELFETAYILYQQFKELGKDPVQITVGIINEAGGVIDLSLTKEGIQMNQTFKAPIDEPIVMHKIYKAWKEQKKSMVIDISGEQLREYNKFRNSLSSVDFSNDSLDDRRVIDVAFFSRGLLSITFTEPAPPEIKELLERFAGVFDLTYTRFLDLKKAEKQSRESQIELALERVRASTMAMQKSEELSQTVFLLFQQFKELGENINQASIGIVNEEEWIIEYWVTMYGNQMDKVFKFSIDEPNVTSPIYQAWKEHKRSLAINLSGIGLHDFMTYRAAKGGAAYDESETRRHISVAFFSKGLLNIQTTASASAESIHLLERFAGVFEQTYIRFIDLKKAEAQARESQFELALERVRARTMAMQRSDELTDAASLLFQQVEALGITTWSCGFNIWDKDEKVCTSWMSNNGQLQPSFNIPLTEDPTFIRFYQSRQNGESFYVQEMGGKELKAHYEYLLSLAGVDAVAEKNIESGLVFPTHQFNHIANFSHGNLQFITYEPAPDAHDLFRGLAKVFEMTYRRFLDLKQAEAQARESQIQLALERVRARTMAMQRSGELAETVSVLFKQLLGLGIPSSEIRTCGIATFRGDEPVAEQWITDATGEIIADSFVVRYDEAPSYKNIYTRWEQGEKFLVQHLLGDSLQVHLNYLKSSTKFPASLQAAISSRPEMFWHVFYFSQGYLFIITYGAFPEFHEIFKRFGNVFEQSYTRFLDLQKAEAQAREAKIEAALEKVRSRSMAMHKSDELQQMVRVLYDQLSSLDLILAADKTITIATFNEDKKEMNFWITGEQFPEVVTTFVPYTEHAIISDIWKAKEKGGDYFSKVYSFEEKNKYWAWAFEFTNNKDLPETVKKFLWERETYAVSFAFAKHSGISVPNYEGNVPSEKDKEVLIRFAKVFDQSYVRFLDLQKAEEQSREAHIEAALERVRSRTMAMQNSDELAELVATVFTELNRLEFALTSCIIWINNPELLRAEMWVASTELNEPPEPYYIKPFRHPYFKSVIDAWKQKNKKWVYEMKGEEKKHFQAAFFNEVGSFPNLIKKALEAPESVVYSASFYNFGAIEIVATEHITDEKFEILHRLGKVFDMSYTRFNDLKQAEAQAREARIEAALERVRSRTLAMQKSDELAETAAVLFQQFAALGILPDRIYIGTFMEEVGELECWVTDQGGNHISNRFRGKIDRPGFSKMYAAWKAKEKSLTLVQTGTELDEYIHFLRDELGLSFAPDRIWKQRVQNIAFFSKGLIGVTTPEIQPPETINLVERFAAVFNLSYTRFLDLQKAEAQAREVVKQASVDRVRAEIASMRTTDDLEKITPLIWNELITLGVPFVRCGVFIMDDKHQLVHTFLSTPNGKAITAFHLQYEGPGEISQIILHWRKKEVYRQHWDETAFNNWTKNLELQGAIPSADTYLAENRFVDLDLHFLPFLQGMLYVGNESPLSDDELHLVQNLADAFSTAYARYEDFNKLESAKKQIEQTLVDLKQTQAQLVQSEKMASLGELTAGIAHEIQNPLNFVNNFSEVSAELVEELNAEIEKGNVEDAKKIGEDLRQNLEKINHHGKRAGDIVKGMLLHSRTSSGTKEPTDINALADEYVRLAYHGLRAKDKAFNTTMKTEYDASIGEINIIPQDIGRVILNLITNAFHAVDTRKKAHSSFGENGVYEPIVTIGSRSVTSPSGTKWVLLTVKDNGIGMPEKVLDKIFQPFFTTKPTGQGTGLGLSLSYDIVKAHGGEIKVKTEEGMGSEFTIELPIA